ncbi:LuxR C-terminal-related transcriptional regulator [Nocardioides sp. B-3]|uniref:LuxR C-terminal-related transcriptional regulator n=1 Tax=Nocardioides sp. B-3 TaxID=2895565 RepID=UPI002152A444|nr:LuxR C-terminal-related transcriptional regulator [Nocardioides sp. B-3]UUZ60401.1 LuxR C-terminal-related transcriptional regulator [Nocardioides sp. B-3]
MPSESTPVEVDTAVALVQHGGSPVDEMQRERLAGEWFRWLSEDDALRRRLATLSPREREVLELLANGHTVSDIVNDIRIAETTVRSHIKSIRRKLEVSSQLAAVAALHRLGGGSLIAFDRPRTLLPSPGRSRD